MALARRESDRTWTLWLVLIVGVAAAVRLLGLGNQDLWGDEAFSVTTAIGPIRDLIAALSTGEPHPPLYPLVLAGWLRLFGHSEFVARLPSAFAGIASVPVAAAIARRFAQESNRPTATRDALVAGLLVAINPFQVWYSQEARMYIQVSLFAGVSTLLLLVLRRHATNLTAFVYSLSVVGVAGSHYYGLFVPLSQGLVILLLFRSERRLLSLWARATLLAALLYLPWVYLARDIFLHYYGAQPGTVDLPGLALSSLTRLASGWSVGNNVAAILTIALGLLAIFGATRPPTGDTDRFLRAILVSWFLTPFVAGFLISLIRPMYAERYLVVSSLSFVLLVARGVCWLIDRASIRDETQHQRRIWSRALATVALIGCVAAAVGPLDNVWRGLYVKSTYNTHVQDVTDLIQPADAIILDGTSQRPLYSYYVHQPWPMYPLPRQVPLDAIQTATELTAIAASHQGVWIFLYATVDYDPGYLVARWLSQHAYRSFDDWAVSGRLQYYRIADDQTMTSQPTDLVFGDTLRLSSVHQATADLTSGDSLPIGFIWSRVSASTPALRVSLRLVDQTGRTWAQTDQEVGGDFFQSGDWLPGTSLTDHHALLLPPGTPPGDYRVDASVYRADNGQVLPVAGSGAPIEGNGIVLSPVHVTSPANHLWIAGIGGFHPSPATFGDSLQLLGYSGGESIEAGRSGSLNLFWKALSDHPAWTWLDVALIDSAGNQVVQRALPLATNAYPATSWHAGDVLREQYSLPVGARTPAGVYRLALSPGLDPAMKSTVSSVVLGQVQVMAGAPTPPVASPQHAVTATFGNAIELTGYDLSASTIPAGKSATVTLHWADRATVPIDYTVFVHILDIGQKIVAQRDQPPGAGSRPTSAWSVGDTIVDPYSLDLPATLTAGTYSIEVGLYDPGSGKRLTVNSDQSAGDDRFAIAQLEITR